MPSRSPPYPPPRPLQIRPLGSALTAAPQPAAAPNPGAAWATLLVEELCRLGVNMFCVAPGEQAGLGAWLRGCSCVRACVRA